MPWENKEPTSIDFSKWLEGENVELERIKGVIDTDIPFVHMDEGANWFRN